jgi:hypothetical protein
MVGLCVVEDLGGVGFRDSREGLVEGWCEDVFDEVDSVVLFMG